MKRLEEESKELERLGFEKLEPSYIEYPTWILYTQEATFIYKKFELRIFKAGKERSICPNVAWFDLEEQLNMLGVYNLAEKKDVMSGHKGYFSGGLAKSDYINGFLIQFVQGNEVAKVTIRKDGQELESLLSKRDLKNIYRLLEENGIK